ncbi:MAG: transposase [Thermodesulfobacteriota bacterium]
MPQTDHHRRRSIRLPGRDYTAPGAYFVTCCTHDRSCLFGDVRDGEMLLNEFGEVAAAEWRRTPAVRSDIELDEWVVMPNHLHGIIWIEASRAARGRPRPNGVSPLHGGSWAHGCAPLRRTPRSLGSLIAGFKSITTKRINELRPTARQPVWQRNYHEHIIRDDESLNRIRQYICDNPGRWLEDPENPAALKKGSGPP